MNNKLTKVIEGIVIAALGILIAIFGGGTVVDIYFGIVALVLGVTLLVLFAVNAAKTKAIDFTNLILSVILVTVGICLFTPWLSFASLIDLLVVILLGLGIGIAISGIILIAKRLLATGIGEIVIGALLATFSIIYKVNADFHAAFWIVIGIVVALYGVLLIVTALLEKKSK